MKISNSNESATIIGHCAPDIESFKKDGVCSIKIGCIGIHMPHDNCPGIQVFTWLLSQDDANMAYGLAIMKTEYVKNSPPLMSIETEVDGHGATENKILIMPSMVRSLYENSKTQAIVNSGLVSFVADRKQLDVVIGKANELLETESLNNRSGMLLLCPPMRMLDLDSVWCAEDDGELNEGATDFVKMIVAGTIAATRKLCDEGDEDDNRLDELISMLGDALREAGLLRDDGSPEEDGIPLGLNARKFFAEHMN